MATPLTLGNVVFTDFEVPEYFVVGGKQKLVIHSLPGGGRVVDAMGPEDAPIRWSGVFSGQQAAERVRTLEGLRRSGQRQTLTWDAWRYTVVVQDFEANITSSSWIPYRLQLCVVMDPGRNRLDWLTAATAPTLSVGLLSSAALDAAISSAGASLGSSSLGQTIGAAGNLAQYVTARAYGLFAS